jgi:hypothetical protein
VSQKVYSYLDSDDEKSAVEAMEGLSSDDLMDILRMAEDFVRFGPTRRSEISAGLGSLSNPRLLHRKGLVRRVAGEWTPIDERVVYILTALGAGGREVALEPAREPDFGDLGGVGYWSPDRLGQVQLVEELTVSLLCTRANPSTGATASGVCSGSRRRPAANNHACSWVGSKAS